MEGGTSKFKTHTAALYKKKKWSSVPEERPQKWPSQRLESEQPQVSMLGKRRRESQTPAQENLESGWPRKAKRKKRRRESQTSARESSESEQPQVSMLGKRRRESQTPAQENLESEQPQKSKRKKRRRESQTSAQESSESKQPQVSMLGKRRESQTSAQESSESEQPQVSMLGKRRRESQTPAQENLESEQPRKSKRKKKKESQQVTSSLLKNSETFHKAKKTTSAHKKKKNSVWEVDMETGIILVDKENMENLLETSRKDVDIVYVDMSKGQRSAKVDETELPTAEPQKHDCRELHTDVRSKKSQKHPQKVAPWDAVQGSELDCISLPQSVSLSSMDLEGKSTEAAVFCKKKSKKKVFQNQELETVPESLDSSETISESLESTHHGGVAGAGEGESIKESHSIRKKSKKKKHKAVAFATSSDSASVLDSKAENAPMDSPEGNGNLREEDVDHRPTEAEAQACSTKKHREEMQR